MRTSQRAIWLGLLALLAGLLPLVSTSPANAAIRDQALSGDASSMWQTNNEVDALEVLGSRVYAGGRFTRVRPPGTAAGTNETTRTYIAAFNTSTGALDTGFNVTLNGRVHDISASPDGTRLYIAGQFTTANGVTRNRIAAVNPATGALITTFNPNANGGVRSIDSSNTTVYASGDFTTIGGAAKTRMASLSATNGSANTGFTTTLDARGNSILISPDGSRVLVGGNFQNVNGNFIGGMASVSPTSGALQTWQANTDQPINTNCVGRVTDIVASGDTAFVTGEGDPPGCYEGTYSARISDGHMNWLSSCLGASQGLALLNGLLYKASHQHDCAFNTGDARGGYVGATSRDAFTWYRMVAQDTTSGGFTHWSPNTNGAMTTHVGPHVIATDGTQMFVGGDFTQVNGVNQATLTRFRPGSVSTPNAAPTPTVQANKVGGLTVQFPTVYDRDSGTLTYTIYRNGATTPVSTQTVESFPWSRPWLRFDDTNLTPGSTYSYRVRVSDGTHVTGLGGTGSAVVRSTAPPAYDALVNSLGASLHWKLGEAGPSFANSASGGSAGEQSGSVNTQQPGALAGDGAVTLGGDGYVTSSNQVSLSQSFTQSLWFKTTSVTGGSLMAVTDAKNGVGTISDRAVTMDNNGNIVFSVHQPPRAGSPDPLGPRLNNVRQQGPIFNDGRWHQMVASWNSTTGTTDGTATLYVDGIQLGQFVGTAGGLTQGFLRVGYTDLSEEQAVFGRNYYNRKWPETEHFSGSLDEVTVFPRALTATEVGNLFAAGVNGADSAPQPVAPHAGFTSSVNAKTVSFNATGAGGSTDSDGTITNYAWDFGDGTPVLSGTNASPSHTYTTAGSYDVTLTVRDNDNLTDDVTHSVSPTDAPPTPVTTDVVAKGSAWSWKFNTAALPADWRTVVPAGWAVNNAVLGFGGSPTTNIDCCAGNTTQRPLAAYFVKTFQVPDASKATNLRLETVADDGVVIYVNGTEVNRTNMHSGGVYAASAVSTANANAAPVVVNVAPGLLHNGTNTVAVETHLNYRATRNISFDMLASLTSNP